MGYAMKQATLSLDFFDLLDIDHPVGEPSPPSLPERFSANVTQTGGFSSGNATLYYDGVKRVQVNVGEPTNASIFGLPGIAQSSTYLNEDSSYFLLNGVCRPLGNMSSSSSHFYDMWAWLKYSKYGGEKDFEGKNVSVWCFKSKDVNLTLFTAANKDENTSSNGVLPVAQFTEGFSGLPGQTPRHYTYSLTFRDIDATPPPPDKLEIPKACVEPPPTCKAPPPGSISQSSAFSSSSSSSSATSNNNNNKFIMLMDHYIAHPPNIYNLANQDTADMLGDTVFTCFDVRSGGTKKDHYGVISHYKIWVDGRFGQYALCNGYNPGTCVGREDFKVGRESSLGTKEKGGQCANNTDTGSWFSFPEKGQCQSKQQLEDSTPTACTWYIEERVKTVNISCPFYTHGMLSACQNDQGKIPLYEKARSIFETAFLYNDEEKGGCQDLGGPPR
eukprot:jgi/Bigna1/91242/estExt_fgenesh1_pg.C_940014